VPQSALTAISRATDTYSLLAAEGLKSWALTAVSTPVDTREMWHTKYSDTHVIGGQ